MEKALHFSILLKIVCIIEMKKICLHANLIAFYLEKSETIITFILHAFHLELN